MNEGESQGISSDGALIARPRAALYVDGFNLYHPINEMGEPYLKWASLWRLGELICEPHGANLVKVVFCTAVPDDDHARRDRHNTFNAAQRACGVLVIKGHHITEPGTGKRSEKQSDINVALSLMLDGLDDVYDIAILLSADSDQAATARFFSERLKTKKLLAVAPPGKRVPDKVKPHAFAHFVLTKNHLDACVMREEVIGKSGGTIRRPVEYSPDANWIHPEDRPKSKPPKAPKKWGNAVRG